MRNGGGETMTKFLVTEESQRLARWLRLCGYDTVTASATPLGACYRRAFNERRTVLTRNRRVSAGRHVSVVQLASTELEAQLRQLQREGLLPIDERTLFTRCDRCNERLRPIEKAHVESRVPPYVFQTQERFDTCPACDRIYWAATHWQRVSAVLARVREEARDA